MPIENDDVSSVERLKRRSWTGDEKRRIVEESLEPGVSIAKVARRYNLNANQLCTWCRQQGVSATTHNLCPPAQSEVLLYACEKSAK